MKFRKKPDEIEAIQWENNEAEIRDFVKNDNNLKFKDGGKLEVWNAEEKDWYKVPILHYLAKGFKGELYSISPEKMDRLYEKIEEESKE